jgi:hypothetical protein
MEDHFDKLLYLVVGVIYLFLNKSKSSTADKKTVIDKPSEHQPSSTASKNWTHTWEDEAPKAPVVKKTLPQTVVKKMSTYPVHHTTPKLAAQQQPSKKVDRVLRRHSSWKKAIIMVELIQPYA